ncbi:hypothetical protein NPIL_295221 [Nephila pilipes]|uniref:Uncharacterized protein n=1 Tax=Nephila pilipes TaxID=299642 RepID=A0A8X6P3Y0_NEPPI|nr:hypothetical protein NPIL_295221 [Nephila pilipes]
MRMISVFPSFPSTLRMKYHPQNFFLQKKVSFCPSRNSDHCHFVLNEPISEGILVAVDLKKGKKRSWTLVEIGNVRVPFKVFDFNRTFCLRIEQKAKINCDELKNNLECGTEILLHSITKDYSGRVGAGTLVIWFYLMFPFLRKSAWDFL